jgi:hypothetical protein
MLLALEMTALGLTSGVPSAPINGSFESSSFAGWHLNIATGRSTSQPGNQPAGLARVVTTWSPPDGPNPLRSAWDGDRFAILGTQANGRFSGHRTYDLSLNQEIFLAAGATISGWACFFNGDYEAQDSAWVKLLDDTGTTIATPWQEISGITPEQARNATAYHHTSAWTLWSWQAPESGVYQLSLGMTTANDNNLASYGCFDGIGVAPPVLPVPEPAALSLAVLGTTLLWLRRVRSAVV